MSRSWLFTVAVIAALVSSTMAQCVTHSFCGTDDDSGKPLPCAVKRDPVSIESDLLEGACPALVDSNGKPVPACCDAKQAESIKSELKAITALGVSTSSKCFKNFQNLVCQAFCSPRQSRFVAVNGTSTSEEGGQLSATEMVYALNTSFGQQVYDACKDVRTVIFGTHLMRYMCGKPADGKCTPQKFLDFVGAVYSEGGYSPLKIHHVLTESSIAVDGQELEPFSPEILRYNGR